ncbi:hypothetical protein DAI22_12g105150 [Oryza sativa Japonica Group]|nr:hypothetical protein DAI22_12g105150 [Oryza sativa Japonica Group]
MDFTLFFSSVLLFLPFSPFSFSLSSLPGAVAHKGCAPNCRVCRRRLCLAGRQGAAAAASSSSPLPSILSSLVSLSKSLYIAHLPFSPLLP